MEEADAPAGDTEKEYPCIMRAVAGKKKLSTLVRGLLPTTKSCSRIH
jgi:hypothetical protein